MASRSRKRKPVQAGVDAIFTKEENRGANYAAALGIFGLGAGGTFWIWSMTQASPSLSLLSLSLLLVVGGVGMCMYSFSIRRTRQETERLRSALYELEVLPEPKDGPVELAPGPYPNGVSRMENGSPHHRSKTLSIIIVQTVVLVLFYGGLVQEYVSNINMQQWVKSSIWPVAYVLNYNALFLVVGGLSGAAIFQVIAKNH